jgi:hypothetical protein
MRARRIAWIVAGLFAVAALYLYALGVLRW